MICAVFPARIELSSLKGYLERWGETGEGRRRTNGQSFRETGQVFVLWEAVSWEFPYIQYFLVTTPTWRDL